MWIARLDVTSRLKPWLLRGKGYDHEHEEASPLRLHLNECLAGLPEHVVEAAVRALTTCNRYPSPALFDRFRELLAEYSGVDESMVYPYVGADGALRAIFWSLSEPGERVLYLRPTYSMVEVLAGARGLSQLTVDLTEAGEWWTADTDRLVELSRTAELVVVVDPNNPTGSPVLGGRKELVEALCEAAKGFVVLDETYYEFAGYTAAGLVGKCPNLIVVRSLSKSFCLAGFRLGYIIAHSEVVRALSRAFTKFDIPTPSLAAGIAALENREYALRYVEEVKRLREWLFGELRALGYKAYRSVTNFILVRHGRDLRAVLLRHGIAVKRVGEGLYRITVGNEETCRVIVRLLGDGL